MSEIACIKTWVHTTLSGDATLEGLIDAIRTGRGDAADQSYVFPHPAPHDAIYPFITYLAPEESDDLMYLGGTRLWTRGEWVIRVIDRTESEASLWAIEDRIDTLLHAKTGSNTYGTIESCVRVGEISYPEIVDGVRYLHLGGLYEITAQEA